MAVDPQGARRLASGAERSGAYLCPRCGEALVVRCGPILIPHFAHQPGRRCDQVVTDQRHSRAAASRRAALAASGQATLFELDDDVALAGPAEVEAVAPPAPVGSRGGRSG